MRRSWRRGRVLILAVAMLLAASCSSQHELSQTKPGSPLVIHLDTPDKVGALESFEIVYSDLRTERITWYGRPETTEQYPTTYHVITDSQVLACDATSRATRVRYHIQKLTELKDGAEVDLLSPGTDVMATRKSHGTVFTINDQPPKDTAQAALEDLLRLENNDESTRWIRTLGLSTPRRRGETWAIDAASMADELKSQQMNVAPADVTGTVHFENISRMNKISCVNLQAEINISHDYFTPGTGNSEGYTYRTINGSCDSHYTWSIPVSPGDVLQSDFRSDTRSEVIGQYGSWSYVQDSTDNWEQVMRKLPTRSLPPTTGPATQP